MSVQRTAEALAQRLVAFLKPFGLSPTQYNVLRILRGAGSSGLACGEIAGRLITHDPDITRLLDRLEARRLVARVRDHKDRRIITARITCQGLQVLKNLDGPVLNFHQEQLGHLGKKRLDSLIELLELARTEPE